MAKQLNKVELLVTGEPDPLGVWHTKPQADLTIDVGEYPDVPAYRKGIAIELTEEQQTAVDDFFRAVILPQAEAAIQEGTDG